MLSINNPGNIRTSYVFYRGEIRPSSNSSFKQFDTIVHGYRAIFELLHHYILIDYCTISAIISRYAPSSDHNDTNAYISLVCVKCKCLPNAVVSIDDSSLLIQLVAAISYVENGSNPDLSLVIQGFAASSLNLFNNH
jgi:hypothetical protein